MTDWRECRVVRDREGALWLRDDDAWTASADCSEDWPTDAMTEHGPFAPVLDAAGLPVVRTVGDLTARHIGRRVRVPGFPADHTLLATIELWEDGAAGRRVRLTVQDPDRPYHTRQALPLDYPCEVLPDAPA